MARIDPKRPLLPSLFDRLIDEEPEVTREPAATYHQVLREFRKAVRRDLENLLNTRQRALSWPADMGRLDRSLVNYGLPDFTGKNLAKKESQAQFLRSIERIIQQCEPRFKTVKVTAVERADPLDRTLRFRIDALIHAEPTPESVVFDSMVEPVSRSFQVNV